MPLFSQAISAAPKFIALALILTLATTLPTNSALISKQITASFLQNEEYSFVVQDSLYVLNRTHIIDVSIDPQLIQKIQYRNGSIADNNVSCQIIAFGNIRGRIIIFRKLQIENITEIQTFDMANFESTQQTMRYDYLPDRISVGNVELDEFFVYMDKRNPLRIIAATFPIKIIQITVDGIIEAVLDDQYTKDMYLVMNSVNSTRLIVSDFNNSITVSQELQSNTKQIGVCGRGTYIYQLFDDGDNTQLKIYSLILNKYIYDEMHYYLMNAYLHKINQTHLLLGGTTAQKQIHFIMYSITNFQKVIDFYGSQLVSNLESSFAWIMYQNQVIYYQENIHQTVQEQPSNISQTNTTINENNRISIQTQESIKFCYPPSQIIQGIYCVQCHQSCFQCQFDNPHICTSCIYGYEISKTKCVPTHQLRILQHIITFPGFIYIVTPSIIRFIDEFWLFETMNMTYDKDVKGFFQLIRNINENRFFPTLFNATFDNSSDPKAQEARASLISENYLHTFHKVPNFRKNDSSVYLFGTLSDTLVFLLMFGSAYLVRNTILNILFYPFLVIFYYVNFYLGSRANYVAYLFCTEILAAARTNITGKMDFLFITAYFFFIFFYVISFYMLMSWFYVKIEQKHVFFQNLHYKTSAFQYLTILNILSIIQTSIHALVQNSASYKLLGLIVTTIVHFLIIIKYYFIFRIKAHLFVRLFHQIIKFIFLATLLLHSLYQQTLFQVSIHQLELFLLVMLVVFMILEILCGYYIKVSIAYEKIVNERSDCEKRPEKEEFYKQQHRQKWKRKRGGLIYRQKNGSNWQHKSEKLCPRPDQSSELEKFNLASRNNEQILTQIPNFINASIKDEKQGIHNLKFINSRLLGHRCKISPLNAQVEIQSNDQSQDHNQS